jgi:hypothetical protein
VTKQLRRPLASLGWFHAVATTMLPASCSRPTNGLAFSRPEVGRKPERTEWKCDLREHPQSISRRFGSAEAWYSHLRVTKYYRAAEGVGSAVSRLFDRRSAASNCEESAGPRGHPSR